uniref:Uncharacterized protein n=1 Tax=Panstrongylus lignarius TaxID=156445 RepID=A0A224XTA0_9HEMI
MDCWHASVISVIVAVTTASAPTFPSAATFSTCAAPHVITSLKTSSFSLSKFQLLSVMLFLALSTFIFSTISNVIYW